ncbi:zinc finger BED domain-containing protein RICESLEEPER 2-like isoform X1 [Typha latifolia]|uniref:zinc finger BED domain-containing protein RICESLEEPER 2-like isoform X1 n=1 Tax=Typha latifolia TaxID=4733 RepID=UPI003C2BDE88
MSESTATEGNAINAVAAMAVHNPRGRKLRSLVWNDFTKERRVDGSYVAVCNHCKKQLTASSRSGTTHLKNHLGTCLSTKRVMKRKKLVVRRLLLKSADAKGEASEQSHFDQEVSRQDLARMIVRHGYRFSMVQDAGFRTFVRNLQPQFKMVSYDKVKVDCMRIYEGARIRLRDLLKNLPSRVSLSVDMWRSSDGVEYVCLTCHYIDDEWKLKKRILNFIYLEAPLTGLKISKAISEKLHEWGIEKKLAGVVLDNCTADDLVGEELLASLRTDGSLLLNGDLFHVRSCSQVLNLIVQESLESACEMTNRVRANIHYVKSSDERFSTFQKVAKQAEELQKPLVLDSPKSWTSMYLMLDSACQYQEAFTELAESDSEYAGSLSANDWADVKALTECLDVLYHTMEKFPAAEKPTSNLHFNEICGIHLLLKTWCSSPSTVVASIASQMLEKFEQYWNSTGKLMAFASILDPRYKMKSVEYFFKLIYTDPDESKARIDGIHKNFMSLYNEYGVQSANSSKTQAFLCYTGSSTGSVSSVCGNGAEANTFSRITLSDARKGLDQYLQETSSGQTIKSDLDMYFEEAVYLSREGSPDHFDILAWWKSFAAKYPVLSAMARDILGYPVSIVPSDSEARVLNEYLSAMDPIIVQGLICAQDWLQDEVEASYAAGPLDSLALVSAAGGSEGDGDESMIPVNGDEGNS